MSTYSAAALWSSSAHLVMIFSMLLRNIIFARFLSPTDFAIALTFGVVLSLFEYISNFGHENLMQRSKDGNNHSFQSTMQGMMIARGVIVALIIIVVAPHIPKFLNVQNAQFNYALLAVVPLIQGFAHLDHQRLHRRQLYFITAKISLIADLTSVLFALVCVYLWESYWAFYISFVYRHCISTLLSHVWASRPYNIAFDKRYVSELLRFGLPLLLVGFLKYIGTEADKALVANVSGLAPFAIYVLTLLIMVNGANVVSVALSKIFIRRLSLNTQTLAATVRSNLVITFFLIAPILTILCINGEWIIQLIFGTKYAPIPYLFLAVSTLVGMRSLNHWLNQIVIARTSTKLMLYADVVRVLFAVTGVYAIYSGGQILHLVAAYVLAEIAYFFTLAIWLNKTTKTINTGMTAFLIYCAFVAMLMAAYTNTLGTSLIFKLFITALCVVITTGLFLLLSNDCRQQTSNLLRLLNSNLRR